MEVCMKIEINTEYIKLDQFLKWSGAVDSGTTAKYFIENGNVKVNDEICLQRGKKIRAGDVVKVRGIGVFRIIQSTGE
jgi:ribosome-associated protein